MNIPKPTYNTEHTSYNLEQILLFYQANRIDTDLECQRGYVWTSSQKQQLIDTLMNRESIPEFHVIKEEEESIFHYADGKQRITTILHFLTNQLAWEKNQAHPMFHELFENKSKLYFKELPQNFQNMILNIIVHSRQYSNMTPASVTKLFRKLNNGTNLGSFQKGLAKNISIKQYFLDKLMSHPVIPKIFSQSKIEKGDAEQVLIRLMILMKNYDEKKPIACDLTPDFLENYYIDLEYATEEETLAWIQQLGHYQNIIKRYLDWLNTNADNLTLRLKSTYPFLFSIFFSYKNDFNEDLLKLLYEELRETTAAQIVGNGADYGTTKIKKYLNYIEELI